MCVYRHRYRQLFKNRGMVCLTVRPSRCGRSGVAVSTFFFFAPAVSAGIYQQEFHKLRVVQNRMILRSQNAVSFTFLFVCGGSPFSEHSFCIRR